MGIATAALVAGTAVTAYGAVKSSQAGGRAAAAQGAIAEAQYAAAEKAARFAAPTAEELSTLSNQVKLYETANARSKAQLDTLQEEVQSTYGRNIIEMGNQLYSQLTGSASKITQQTNEQIERQRKLYQQQLVDKLGPGAMTSSAGIQAMAAFNREAATTLAQTQESSINAMIQRIGGLQGGQSQALSGTLQINSQLSGMLNQIQSTQNVFQVRQANAWNQVASYAGAEHVGELQGAKNDMATANAISSIGGQVLGAGIGGIATGGKTATTPNQPNSLNTSGFNANNANAWNGATPLTGGNLNFYDPNQGNLTLANTSYSSWDGG